MVTATVPVEQLTSYRHLVTLPDGLRVLLRPLVPKDRDALVALFSGLPASENAVFPQQHRQPPGGRNLGREAGLYQHLPVGGRGRRPDRGQFDAAPGQGLHPAYRRNSASSWPEGIPAARHRHRDDPGAASRSHASSACISSSPRSSKASRRSSTPSSASASSASSPGTTCS